MKINKKKLFASFIALTLVFSLFPMSVFAAPVAGTMTAVEFDGEPMLPVLTFDGVGENAPLTGIVTQMATAVIDEDDADNGIALLDITGEGASLVVRLITVAAQLQDTTSITDGRGLGVEWTDQTLEEGNIILIIDGDPADETANVRAIAILIEFADDNDIPEGTIKGEGGLHNVILNVTVPNQVDFTLNPFQIGVTPIGNGAVRYDNQISPVQFAIVNATAAVPVYVGFEMTATGAAGVTFVSDRDDLNRDYLYEEAKDIFFAALSAHEHDSDWRFISDTVENGESTMSNAMAPFVPATNANTAAGDIAFVLAQQGAADNANEAAFRFYAELNTYAGWLAGDVTVTGYYNLTPLRPATVSEITIAAGTHRKVVGTPREDNDNGLIRVAVDTTLNDIPLWSAANPLTIQFDNILRTAPLVATSVANLTAAPWAATHAAGNWSITPEGLFTIDRVPASGNVLIVRVGDVTVTINFVRP